MEIEGKLRARNGKLDMRFRDVGGEARGGQRVCGEAEKAFK